MRDPVFLGLTRPTLLFGMPYEFFLIAVVAVMLVFLLTVDFLITGGLAIVLYLVGIYLGHSDPFLGKIWAVRLLKRIHSVNQKYWKANSYHP